MLTAILSLLNLIPGLENLVSGILTAKFNKDVSMYQARTGVARDVAVAQIQANAQIQNKYWFVALISVLFAVPCIAYVWKAIGWDKVIGPVIGYASSTDAINDPNLGWAFVTIIGGFFANSIISKVLDK